jgi:hypothetical protein
MVRRAPALEAGIGLDILRDEGLALPQVCDAHHSVQPDALIRPGAVITVGGGCEQESFLRVVWRPPCVKCQPVGWIAESKAFWLISASF